MSLGRRKIRVDDPSRWVFNRMADVYDARPAYPAALVDAVAALAGGGGLIGDVAAGIGHLALPLADRGCDVVAIEPAHAMLDRLSQSARDRGLSVRSIHAAAERLPLADGCLRVAAVVDALHFLDRELAANEIARVLAPSGVLVLVTCEFADTPFMRGVADIMADSVPRRRRELSSSIVQLSAVTQVQLVNERRFHDDSPVDHVTLERILRSISFIGPAMNPQRFAAFRKRLHALSDTPVWSRTFTLQRPAHTHIPREPPPWSKETSKTVMVMVMGDFLLDRPQDDPATALPTSSIDPAPSFLGEGSGWGRG